MCTARSVKQRTRIQKYTTVIQTCQWYLTSFPKVRPSLAMNSHDDEFYRALGIAVRRRRKELGLTQEELGERLVPPMTRASIANIEGGKQRVLAHTLVELAAVLKSGVNDLVTTNAMPGGEDPELEHEIVGKIGEAIGPKAAKALARKVISVAARR